MKKTEIRKILKETKAKKDRILIEESLVESRFMMIIESKDILQNLDNLSKKQKEKLAWEIINEINYLQDNNILNEEDGGGLGGFLSRMFGSSLGSILETIVEPLVNSILSGLGIGGYFKDFLVSFITSRPGDLAKALKDCRALTTLVANSLAEAMFMKIQNEKGMQGGFWTFLRNALGGAVKDTGFVNKIEDFIGDTICSVFDKLTGRAGDVLGKLQPALAGA